MNPQARAYEVRQVLKAIERVSVGCALRTEIVS